MEYHDERIKKYKQIYKIAEELATEKWDQRHQKIYDYLFELETFIVYLDKLERISPIEIEVEQVNGQKVIKFGIDTQRFTLGYKFHDAEDEQYMVNQLKVFFMRVLYNIQAIIYINDMGNKLFDGVSDGLSDRINEGVKQKLMNLKTAEDIQTYNEESIFNGTK